MKFDEVNWHDSIIKNISIDRNDPGNNDLIKLEIEWPDHKNGELVFKDVYWANLSLNFGVVADESILDAFLLERTDEDLINLYSKWKGAIDDIELNVYLISLNSTGGEIKIISRGFDIL